MPADGGTTQGRRYPDVSDTYEPHERMEPGGYRREHDSHTGRWHWTICDPRGHIGRIDNHTVTEHEDGTITVEPSILDANEGGWHGYLRCGVWEGV